MALQVSCRTGRFLGVGYVVLVSDDRVRSSKRWGVRTEVGSYGKLCVLRKRGMSRAGRVIGAGRAGVARAEKPDDEKKETSEDFRGGSGSRIKLKTPSVVPRLVSLKQNDGRSPRVKTPFRLSIAVENLIGFLAPREKGDLRDIVLMSLSFAVLIYISQHLVHAYCALRQM